MTEAIFKRAHQTSAKYEKGVSEFKECGLMEEYLNDFPAPFVKECAIKINDTILIVGKVERLIFPEEILESSGHLNIHSANSLTMSGLDTYFTAEKLERMPYASKPK